MEVFHLELFKTRFGEIFCWKSERCRYGCANIVEDAVVLFSSILLSVLCKPDQMFLLGYEPSFDS